MRIAALTWRDRLVAGQHAGDGEEAGLQDGVGAARQARRARHATGVDGVHGQPLGDDLLLHRPGERVPDLVGGHRCVQQQGAARPGHGEHVQLVQQRELVAAHEARLAHQVRRPHRVRPEAQVRHRRTAGLLAVVDEVGLRVHVGVGAEDLDGVLVRADRAVRAEPEEDRPQRLLVLDVQVPGRSPARCPRRRRRCRR